VSEIVPVAAARSAKAYKYAYEAQDAAQQWADFFLGGMDLAGQAGCPSLIKPSKKDLIEKAFGPLSDTPDGSIPGGMNYESLPCPKKGCRGCKGPNCRNDNKSDNDGTSNTNEQAVPTTRKEERTLATSTFPPKTTASPLVQASSRTTSILSSSSATSSVAPVSTLGCKGLASVYASEEEPKSDLRRRGYPINLQHLKGRADGKPAKACGIVLKSFRYPSAGEWKLDERPKKYGFNTWNSCDNYDWGNPDTGPDVKYETEHVLEWQIVGGFFTKMGEEITTEFDHPDPSKDVKIKFCEYWTESWGFASTQIINNPMGSPQGASPGAVSTPIAVAISMSNSGTVSPVSSSAPVSSSTPVATPVSASKRTPLHWLASQYPYREVQRGGDAWLDEMPLLEKRINGQNKEPVSAAIIPSQAEDQADSVLPSSCFLKKRPQRAI
jgi:hypothetical protein